MHGLVHQGVPADPSGAANARGLEQTLRERRILPSARLLPQDCTCFVRTLGFSRKGLDYVRRRRFDIAARLRSPGCNSRPRPSPRRVEKDPSPLTVLSEIIPDPHEDHGRSYRESRRPRAFSTLALPRSACTLPRTIGDWPSHSLPRRHKQLVGRADSSIGRTARAQVGPNIRRRLSQPARTSPS